MLKKLIGDRAFYKRVIALMIPIMIQTGITNFVNMLDNIMVGRVGTDAMTGVAVANQFTGLGNRFNHLCVLRKRDLQQAVFNILGGEIIDKRNGYRENNNQQNNRNYLFHYQAPL